jgi:uncharacterized SAM-binding protein YcdF (DUF218 family)
MFILSKILAWLVQPLNWILALLLVGLVLQSRFQRLSRHLLWAAMAIALLTGWQALPAVLIHTFESRYAEIAPQADLRNYVGMVVLGGATEAGAVQQAHSQPLLGGGAERLTAPIAALRRNPHLRLLYTGGEGSLMGTGPSEAERARVFFDSMGAPSAQITYESKSRNTYENAVLSAQLSGVDPTQRWLLVTSATHMPRSMATFDKAGWNVTAYPVDFQTGNDIAWADYSLLGGANAWGLILHEVVGLLAYRVTGRL